jgi:hypothetical protein
MKKTIKKIVLVILVIFLIIFFIYYIGVPALDRWEFKAIVNFMDKTDKIEYGMSKKEVIDILGKPRTEYWIKAINSDVSNEIKAKNKKIFVLEYRLIIWRNKIAKIYFDEQMKFLEREFIPWIPFDIY